MSEELHLWINERLLEKIRQHGEESYPHECCGALLGLDADGEVVPARGARQVLEIFPVKNRREDSPRNRFSVTSEDVREADRAACVQGLGVIGWYHSHPDHPARPSEYDREHAWPWYSYIIVSVESGKAQDLTSWRLQDDRSRFLPEVVEMGTQAEA
jgi:proteasome lid subunit RPN8/RPN11